MPKEKATKAYKFARPFHGPFRVVEVLDAGVVVRPVDPLRGESIRVAVNQVRRCPEAVPEGESWPARKPARKSLGKRTSSKKTESSESNKNPDPTVCGRVVSVEQCSEQCSRTRTPSIRVGTCNQWNVCN